MTLWLAILLIIISGAVGFIICALLTASKITDLNDEIQWLRWVNQDLSDDCVKLHHTVVGIDLASGPDRTVQP